MFFCQLSGFFYSGSNRHLDLDGILFLGGVRTTMYSNLPGQIISKHGYQVTARKCSLLCFGYHTQYQPCKAELNLKILVTLSTLISSFRDVWQTWMLVVTPHILSRMLWCLPNMSQMVVEVNIKNWKDRNSTKFFALTDDRKSKTKILHT